MATENDEIQQWCDTNGFGNIAVGLRDFIEKLDALTFVKDDDIKEIVTTLQLPIKIELKFKKAIKLLKQTSNQTHENINEMTKNKEIVEEKEKLIIKSYMPIKSGTYVIPTINKKKIKGPWKTIMLIGETGSGKSTTINSMINYLFNVSFNDHYRFVLIPPPKEYPPQGELVTSEVTSYHIKPPMLDYGLTIVDTPGFSGDIATDIMTSKKIKAVQNSLDTIDAVFFVLKGTVCRLTAMQIYVFNSMLRLFGKDIESNLFLLITFFDGGKPSVYAPAKRYGLPYKDGFELNNSAFFTGFKNKYDIINLDIKNNCVSSLSHEEQLKWLKNKPIGTAGNRKVTQLFWEMGIDAMKNLFDKLGNIQSKSLTQSRKVLDLRNYLQIRIEELHTSITHGLNLISRVRQIIYLIKLDAKDVNSSKNFEIEVMKTRCVKYPTQNNVMTCTNCMYTCHRNCAKNADKKNCSAMNSNGYCEMCPRKCYWNCHTNEHYEYKFESYKTTIIKEKLKKKFDKSTKGLTVSERILISQTEKIIKLQTQLSADIVQVRSCIELLGEIALKPCVMEEDEYYELMMESEKEQKEPNYMDRIDAIKALQQQAKQVKILSNKNTKGNELGHIFSTQLEQLTKNLDEIKIIQGDAPNESSKILQRVTRKLEQMVSYANAIKH